MTVVFAVEKVQEPIEEVEVYVSTENTAVF